MPFMACAMLKQNNLQHIVNYHKYISFFAQIYNQYSRSVSYHNDLHGSDVAQHCHMMLKEQNFAQLAQFDDLDTLSLLVAALCHDV